MNLGVPFVDLASLPAALSFASFVFGESDGRHYCSPSQA